MYGVSGTDPDFLPWNSDDVGDGRGPATDARSPFSYPRVLLSDYRFQRRMADGLLVWMLQFMESLAYWNYSILSMDTVVSELVGGSYDNSHRDAITT